MLAVQGIIAYARKRYASAASLWKKAGFPEIEMDVTGLFQTG